MAAVDWILCGVNLTLAATGKQTMASIKAMQKARQSCENELVKVDALQRELFNQLQAELWRRIHNTPTPPPPPPRLH